MAVVESAADGLALTMPTLGLGLPRNYAHLSGDTDQSTQLQLHHTHQQYHHHHHQQLHHHQTLLHQQNTPKLSHIDEDQKVQHNISSLTQTDSPVLVNADSHTGIDTAKLATEKFASSDSISTNSTSTDGITSKPQISKMGQSVGVFEVLPHAKGELNCEKTFSNAACTPLKSIYDQMENQANAQKIDGGKAPTLPISPHAVNGASLKQCEKDIMHKLEENLSKLNPLAKEFVPSTSHTHDAALTLDNRQPKNITSYTQGRRNPNGRTSKTQRDDSIRRTVYVSDIDQQVTEEQLAALFLTCGPVVDCRVCGDPNSVLRFAFVEFTNEGAARAALGLAGTMLGYYPVRVLPSKTAIVPVNPTYLPHSEEEHEMCARTVYCTNLDKKVSQADVKLFFETICGEVGRLRLLGDYRHSTRIAFVEFVRAECAMAALDCSGAILGSMPLRVSPSKTPVRPRSPRFLSL